MNGLSPIWREPGETSTVVFKLPNWMSKTHKGNNPSRRIKAVNDAVTTELEIKPVLNSEANRKSL